jgi:hypothetical protein
LQDQGGQQGSGQPQSETSVDAQSEATPMIRLRA